MLKIFLTPNFAKKVKQLCKKYPSLPSDLKQLEKDLKENPLMGVDLGNGLRKIRMRIASKGRGKSGGARVITHTAIVTVEEGVITLLTIYDKSEMENISERELNTLLHSVL